MTDLERRLRRGAEQARTTAHESIDIDEELSATLERARSTSSVRSIDDTSPRRVRGVAVAAAAVLLIGLTAGGLTLLRGEGDNHRLTDTAPSESIESTSSSTESEQPSIAPPPAATTTAAPTTTPTTVIAEPSTTIDPATQAVSPGGAVSYLAPPATLALRPLGTAALAAGNGENGIDVAIGDRGVVINQSDAGYVTVIGFDGSQHDVPVDGPLGALVYGPGEVVYGLRQGDAILELAMVAVALNGDRAGTTVASTPLPIVTYTELPVGSFGHGRDGVLDRERDVNATIAGYVGIDGRPSTWTEPTPTLLTVTDGTTVSTLDGRVWRLQVEASPTKADTFDGPSPAAPSSSGIVVYWTYIGPSARPDLDSGEPTMPVIAALRSDGSVRWWSIPQGWQVVASDVWGTVLAKLDNQRLELALADFGSDADQPTPTSPGCLNNLTADVAAAEFTDTMLAARASGEFGRCPTASRESRKSSQAHLRRAGPNAKGPPGPLPATHSVRAKGPKRTTPPSPTRLFR